MPYYSSLLRGAEHSAIGNNHLYTGRERDPETGLQLNRYRYYAPHLGRWINQDPIRYRGGMNLYAYVSGRPTYYLDPLGLVPPPVRPPDDWPYPRQERPWFPPGTIIIDPITGNRDEVTGTDPITGQPITRPLPPPGPEPEPKPKPCPEKPDFEDCMHDYWIYLNEAAECAGNVAACGACLVSCFRGACGDCHECTQVLKECIGDVPGAATQFWRCVWDLATK